MSKPWKGTWCEGESQRLNVEEEVEEAPWDNVDRGGAFLAYVV